MCRASTCGLCNKQSWYGCGNHIASVMDNVDTKDWCTCKHNSAGETNQKYPPKAGTGIKASE